MTNRQKKLGVTEYGYNRGIKSGEFMADYESFEAKAATIKKGQYIVRELVKAWFPEFAWSDTFISTKHDEIKRYFFGLTVNHPEAYYYTDTNGLDCLTVY